MKKSYFAPAKISLRYFGIVLAIALSAPFLVAQRGITIGRARILPSVVHLALGQKQPFKIILAHRLDAATVMKDVQWSVNDIPGGNAQIGTIDSNGVYHAPEAAPKPHEIHICAVDNGAANRYLWATVIIGKADPTYKVVRNWGEMKKHLVHLKGPHGITLDKDGNLIIEDRGSNRVLRYTPDGKYLGQIGHGPGDSEIHRMKGGYFTQPRAGAVDAEGNIFISDEKADDPRIQEFTPQGKFIRMFGLKGNRPGMQLRPHGMQFGTEGQLFVADVDNFRVSVYTGTGKFLYCWGKGGLYPGYLNPPHGLALDKNNDVFIDSFYGPAQKFTAHGHFLKAFAYPNPPNGPVTFHTLNGDRWGDVYVTTHSLKHNPKHYVSILKYNDNGDFITALRLSNPYQEAMWVAVAKDGTVYALYQGKKEVGVQTLVEQ